MASQKLFKTFGSELIKSLSISLVRNYYYIDEFGERRDLIEKKVDPLANNDKYVKLEDEERAWVEYRQSTSLFLDLKISIKNVVNIYHGSNQACYPKAKLGIGLAWKALNSKFKYCKKLGEIDDYIDEYDNNIEGIEIKCPNSDIEFKWFVYVIDPGQTTKNGGYANTKGMIIALEHGWTIMVSGNGSIFPIEEYSKPGEPLWHTRVDFIDWKEDEFSIDNLAIVLNPAHPLFAKIDSESDDFDELIFKEVLSSALAALVSEIIVKAKDNHDFDEIFDEPLEEKGSILSAIRFFKSALNFDVDKNISELEKSIKRFFDKEKKICK